ncbi:hypothetical protein AVEN_128642-1 [Araneus ventricosus]|uniref:Mariner Mos1 transposase n=1 Tax=Araneus ventricosus TaxID=182803 RepID=A0A4Y2LXN5_ARAVE|nr:hypothetical protein AVEN_128642-1 [Araneus ventricosus]
MVCNLFLIYFKCHGGQVVRPGIQGRKGPGLKFDSTKVLLSMWDYCKLNLTLRAKRPPADVAWKFAEGCIGSGVVFFIVPRYKIMRSVPKLPSLCFEKEPPRFQLHKTLWVAVSSTVRHRVERHHHLKSVCLQDVILVDQTAEKSGWSVLQHPFYSPDLAPSDFQLFGPLKQHLGGKHFADDDDVQHEILLWMRQQPKEFYAAGIGALIKRWDKCINIGGDYVEK